MDNLPLILVIIDGFGLAPDSVGNAITRAKTPVYDDLWQNFSHTELEAAGLAVGLPEGQMGNSEVGHLNIGAGRIVKQSLIEIDDAIASGQLEKNPILNQAFTEAKHKNKLHLIGLVSDGGIHSHINHLIALVRYAKASGIDNVFIHAITDGRDSKPDSGLDFVQQLDLELINIGAGEIATISGRYYAMDRDKRWQRTQKYYDAIHKGLARHFDSAEEAIDWSYQKQITDEFIEPAIISPKGLIKPEETVICFNFRPDRMIQIVSSLENPAFIQGNELNLNLYSMTKYHNDLNAKVLFPKQILKKTLGEILSNQGLTQARIAETEKYPHVTYFFNGGLEQTFKKERRQIVPSPKVATYDMQPEMSAQEVADAVIEDLTHHKSDVIIVNFANCDMVGHTGVLEAAIKATETVDTQIGRILDKLKGTILITADHGNVEKMLNSDGSVCTTHTTNRVPLIINNPTLKLKPHGKLSDVAPTILNILQIKQPIEMTGESLIQNDD